MPVAPSRLRLYDWRLSRGPGEVGVCDTDRAANAAIVNAAQERLITAREAGDAGWWGTWAEMLFNVDADDPFITTPRGVARLEYIDLCDQPIPLRNQFYEFTQFGGGYRHSGTLCDPARWSCDCRLRTGFDRGLSATWASLIPGATIRVIPSNAADTGGVLRTCISGLDTNNRPVSTLDGGVVVDGEFVEFTLPFANTLTPWNAVTAIQKDVTIGSVSFYQIDPGDASLSLLLIMEPGETVAAYRRYYLDRLPASCCPVPGATPSTAQVRALAKLDLVPAAVDSDYLLIQSMEALIAEAQSMRLAAVDGTAAKTESRERHNAAIGLLQGQLVHQLGKQQPAVVFAPFGHAALARQKIGTLI